MTGIVFLLFEGVDEFSLVRSLYQNEEKKRKKKYIYTYIYTIERRLFLFERRKKKENCEASSFVRSKRITKTSFFL